MANDFSGNPYKVDTVSAVSAIANNTWFEVSSIVWTSASVSGQAVVQDASGTLKWEWYASGDVISTQTRFDPPIKFNGLLVPTLGIGTLKLYVKPLR